MAKQPPETGKVYHTIGEVADMFGVNTSLIRFWEKEFPIINPHKNKKGNRLFTPKDVENFHVIYHLVKERGYTLKGARDYIKKQKPEKVETEIKVVQTLDRIKVFLQEMKSRL